MVLSDGGLNRRKGGRSARGLLVMWDNSTTLMSATMTGGSCCSASAKSDSSTEIESKKKLFAARVSSHSMLGILVVMKCSLFMICTCFVAKAISRALICSIREHLSPKSFQRMVA